MTGDPAWVAGGQAAARRRGAAAAPGGRAGQRPPAGLGAAAGLDRGQRRPARPAGRAAGRQRRAPRPDRRHRAALVPAAAAGRTGRAGDAEIDAELDRDATDAGRRHAAACRAAIPDAEHKAAAWRLLAESAELGLEGVVAVARGLQPARARRAAGPVRGPVLQRAARDLGHARTRCGCCSGGSCSRTRPRRRSCWAGWTGADRGRGSRRPPGRNRGPRRGREGAAVASAARLTYRVPAGAGKNPAAPRTWSQPDAIEKRWTTTR